VEDERVLGGKNRHDCLEYVITVVALGIQ
jgi:hypothetical protein